MTRSLFSDKDSGANRYKHPTKKTSKLKVNTSFGGSIAGVGYADRFQKELVRSFFIILSNNFQGQQTDKSIKRHTFGQFSLLKWASDAIF